MVLKGFFDLFKTKKQTKIDKNTIFTEFDSLLSNYFSENVMQNINTHKFENNVLSIHCLRQEMIEKLQERKDFLLVELNKKLGQEAVSDIVFTS